MAEAEQKFDPLKMTIYQFRDTVANYPKDVLGIRKLSFLQNTTYNEAMEGIFHLTQALYWDHSQSGNSPGGDDEPVVETELFGPNSIGVTWCPCPFNVNLIATASSTKPLAGDLKGAIEFSARGIKLNEHFDGEFNENPIKVKIINTDRFHINATITPAVVDKSVNVTCKIVCCVLIAGQTVKETYKKTITIKL